MYRDIMEKKLVNIEKCNFMYYAHNLYTAVLMKDPLN